VMGSFSYDSYQDVETNVLVDDDPADWTSGSTVSPTEASESAVGDRVAVWQDQSGAGRDAWHGTLVCRPVLTAVGSLVAMRFGGGGEGMVTGLTIGVPLTVFAVYASHVATSGAYRVVQGA